MTIPHEIILTLQRLKGFGPKKIELIAHSIHDLHCSYINLDDLYRLIKDMHQAGRLKGLSVLPEYDDMEMALDWAWKIIRKSEMMEINMISRYDKGFPANLLMTVNEKGKPDVPILLFYKGSMTIADLPAVAIIGTREPSKQGIQVGEKLGEIFATHGYNVVSGLAVGCDTAGHRGALNASTRSSASGTTAFLAHGLDTIYPPQNKELAEEIVTNGGLLMSEYPIGVRVNRNFLISRDRLQAAMADGTIVVQTGIKGGTMHAVNATLAAGKTVYAVDYNQFIPDDRDAGNKWLINSGRAVPLPYDALPQVLDELREKHNAHFPSYTQGSLFAD